MLAAHMVKIGFLVSHIDEKGFLYLNPVGGFDNLCAHGDGLSDPNDPSKDLIGILNSGKPITSPLLRSASVLPCANMVDLGIDKQVEKR